VKKVLIAKKIGMTQVLNPSGTVTPVTVAKISNVHILDILSIASQGYNALRLTAIDKKSNKSNKPHLGQFKKSGIDCKSIIFELKVQDTSSYKDITEFTIDSLKENQTVIIKSVSKGKGFTGTIRKHGFSRGPETHGSKNHRLPGSIGAGTSPSRVLKGTKMAGKHGNNNHTLPATIIKIDVESSLVYFKGSFPGSNGSFLRVYTNEN